MTATFFVTGTDTGVGKTRVAVALLHFLKAQGLRAQGMKPVASGCDALPEGLRNADALALARASATPQPYDVINPYAFLPPVAPHLAAAAAGVRIDLGHIEACHRRLGAGHDVCVVEGAGGWRVPLDDAHTMADLARVLNARVILVVGLRLGCLNHALLTAEAIARDGLDLAGWIGSAVDPDFALCEENRATLRARLQAPELGILPHGASTLRDDVPVRRLVRGLRSSS